MSFILDALKKLEEKRQSESVPDLTTVHIEGNIQKKRPYMTYILIGVLLLNAVMVAIWLRPMQKESNTVTAQAAKVNVEIPAPAAPVPDITVPEKNVPPVQDVVKTAPVSDIAVTESPEVPVIDTASLPINPSPEEISELKNIIAEEQLSVDTSPSLEPALEEEIPPATETEVLVMSQLPSSIQKALPDLTLSAHIYSNNPMSRLINIKGNILREGDTVTTGLKVNEITVSGVIFDYGGLLFSVRAF